MDKNQGIVPPVVYKTYQKRQKQPTTVQFETAANPSPEVTLQVESEHDMIGSCPC